MYEGFTEVKPPLFGGSHAVVLANQDAVLVDGTPHVCVRIPIDESGCFTRAGSPFLEDKQLVVQMSCHDVRNLRLGINVIPRKGRPGVDDENLYIHHGLFDLVNIDFQITKTGNLVITATKPTRRREKVRLASFDLKKIIGEEGVTAEEKG